MGLAIARQLVARGDRVGLLMPNGIDWATAAVAVMRVGAVLVPLSTLLRPPELRAQLEVASVTHLIAVRAYRGRTYADDLRSLAPYDWEAIRASVEKTSKVMVAHEDCLSWGYGAEIAARIADELFHRLDAPVRRVAAHDVPLPYAPQLEDFVLPQVPDVIAAARWLARY